MLENLNESNFKPKRKFRCHGSSLLSFLNSMPLELNSTKSVTTFSYGNKAIVINLREGLIPQSHLLKTK